MNFTTTRDLKKFVLKLSGELTDGTSEYDDEAVRLLDRAHKALLSGGAELGIDVGQPWAWAVNKYPSVLMLTPYIQTFIAQVTWNSNQIVFSTPPAINVNSDSDQDQNPTPLPVSVQDWYFQLDNFPECYRIQSHNIGDVNAVIDSVYANENSSGGSCILFKIDYDLDENILRLVAPFKTYRNDFYYHTPAPCVDMIDDSEFGRTYPLWDMLQGTPDKFSQIYKSNNTMRPRVRFNRIPDQMLRLEYNYIPVPAFLQDNDESIPIVPMDHRITLGYYAAYFLCMVKNDNRAAEYRELAKSGIIAMKRANQVEKMNASQYYGRMTPRPDLDNARKKIWGISY